MIVSSNLLSIVNAGLLADEKVSKDDNNNAVPAEVVSVINFLRLIGMIYFGFHFLAIDGEHG
jgi:hypothetical protein